MFIGVPAGEVVLVRVESVDVDGQLKSVFDEEIADRQAGGFRRVRHMVFEAGRGEQPEVGIAEIDADGLDHLEVREAAAGGRVGTGGVVDALEDGLPGAEDGSRAGGGGSERAEQDEEEEGEEERGGNEIWRALLRQRRGAWKGDAVVGARRGRLPVQVGGGGWVGSGCDGAQPPRMGSVHGREDAIQGSCGWCHEPWLGGAAPSAPRGMEGRPESGLRRGAASRLGRRGRVGGERLRRSAAPQDGGGAWAGRMRFRDHAVACHEPWLGGAAPSAPRGMEGRLQWSVPGEGGVASRPARGRVGGERLRRSAAPQDGVGSWEGRAIHGSRVGTMNGDGGRCSVSAAGHGKRNRDSGPGRGGFANVRRGGCVRSGCDGAQPPRMGLVHGKGGGFRVHWLGP
jgi:hypothetical protein